MNDKEVLDMFIEAGLVDLPDIELKAPWLIRQGFELAYNTDEDEEGLLEGDGSTYSGEIKDQRTVGDYVIFTLDSGCGYDYQVILSSANEVGYE